MKQKRRFRPAKIKRQRAGFPVGSPEEQQMSAAQLDKVRVGTRLEVQELGSCVGVAHIVLRRGKCVFALADGWSNIAKKARFNIDTICRLHGSTKSLVCAAFMTLVDEGKVRLDDPVAKYIKFSKHVVTATGRVRLARVLPTIRHLLTQTAGLKYTDCHAYKKIMNATRQGKIIDLSALCSAIAEVPLQFEPGTQYEYSFCTDFVGHLCEVISGESLEAFVKRRLLQPLGMKDTGFSVPKAKKSRVALLYECKDAPASQRRRGKMPYVPKPYTHPDSTPIKSAGGGILSYMDAGMWGTARDYVRFCQMLLAGGVAPHGGPRILKPASFKAIWRDGLQPLTRKGPLRNWDVDDTDGPPFEGSSWKKCGWSLVNSLQQFDTLSTAKGSARIAHTMGLGGGGGTYWCVDFKRKLVAVTFSQSFDGGRSENDGKGPPGNDCVDIAIAAVDEGVSRKRRKKA